MRNRSFLIFGAMGLLIPATQAAAVQENFDIPGITPFTFTSTTGSAPSIQSGGPTGNFARLINLNGSNNNSLAFDESPFATGPAPLGLGMSFDFRMSTDAQNAAAGGCCGEAADGIGFGLFPTAVYGTTGGNNPGTAGNWETPSFPGAFTVGLDIFQANNVSLNFPGGSTSVDPGFLLNSDKFHRLVLLVTPDGTNAIVNLGIIEDVFGTAIPHTVYTNVAVPGFDLNTLPSYRVIAGGRTGGAFAYGDIDNISVVEVVPEPTSIGVAGLGLSLAMLRRRRRA